MLVILLGSPAAGSAPSRPAPDHTIAPAQQQAGRTLSRRQALSQARRAMAAGRIEEALDLYAVVLAQTPQPGRDRAEALLNLGMGALALPGRDPESARPMLQELSTSYPTHERRLEVASMLRLLDDTARHRSERENLQRTLTSESARRGELAAELEALRQQAAESQPDVAPPSESEAELEKMRVAARRQTKENQGLRAELEAVRAELEAVRAELQKKDDAIRKLTDALVGRKP
jgi:hypothetical protein